MSNNLTELLASIQVRDESIHRALEDIEQKLAAWSKAVAEFEPAPRTGGSDPAASAVNEAPSHSKNPTERPEKTIAPAVEVEEAVTSPAVDKPAPEAPAPAVAENATGYDVVDGEPEETPVARPASPDDDESVLAGLSPESAKAIKVQWRLLEGTKSLRQLVEEHKARLVRGDAKDSKRSWWGRGKG